MEILQVTVSKRLLSGKDTLRQAAPILIWLFSVFAIFITMCITEFWILLIPFILVFISVVPTAVWSVQRANKIRQEAYTQTDVLLTAENRAIYKDGKKLNISYIPQENMVYLDNEHRKGKFKFYHLSFAAIIYDYNAIAFLDFCKRNNVNIKLLDDKF